MTAYLQFSLWILHLTLTNAHHSLQIIDNCVEWISQKQTHALRDRYVSITKSLILRDSWSLFSSSSGAASITISVDKQSRQKRYHNIIDFETLLNLLAGLSTSIWWARINRLLIYYIQYLAYYIDDLSRMLRLTQQPFLKPSTKRKTPNQN